MEQVEIPICKIRPMRPIFYTHLVTSTPDSHQISKKIKGSLANSEHYKGNRVDYPNFGPRFSPLQTRDYRKARELTLEIWDPMIQTSFLEKFLKSQKNLLTIRIRVLTKKEYKGQILMRLCEILSKNGGLNRVHIDFGEQTTKQMKQKLFEGIRSLRKLPKLKDFEVTVNGEQVLPFSLSLEKVGFHRKNGSFTVEDASIIQRLIQKTCKFHHLDTIKIAGKTSFKFSGEFLDALVLVISKLPNFRELDFSYSKDLSLPVKQTLNLLDTLAKAPKFEIFKLELQMNEMISQISLLKHPLFKAKSLQRTSISLLFYRETAPEDLDAILDILGGMPSLYGLCLDFSNSQNLSDMTVEVFMKKLNGMTSIRKLKIKFAEFARTPGTKQAGDMIRSIFNMSFLEELSLTLPKDCLDLGENNDIQGLPRLKKVYIRMASWSFGKENEIRGVVELLGKCHQLRELELFLSDGVRYCERMTMKLCESLRKLKELQVFRLYASAGWRYSHMTQELMWEFLMTWNGLRNLQDLTIFMDMNPNESSLNYREQTAISINKIRPMKPILYTHLVTSTPDSHRISKRIKGLFGCSEHYKGNRVNDSNAYPSFSPLRARDYRKARELTFEIWDPIIQAPFLEKFLKFQKNLEIIRIRVMRRKKYKGEILKRLCGILSKNSGLNRIHIDFDKEQRKQAMPHLTKGVRSLRKLPKLKDLEVTVDGEQVLPFSVSLEKVGFHNKNGSLLVKDLPVIKKLINKASKINFLDTIRIDSKKFSAFSDKFWDALGLVISKLPNFRELDINCAKDFSLPLEQTFNILDTLMKAPKFEIFKLELHMEKMKSQISLLEHPFFKAKSLKRTSLSLFFYDYSTFENLNQIFDLLGGMPSLYRLCLDFSSFKDINDKTVGAFMKRIIEIRSLRKLKIHFAETSGNVGAKQVEDLIRSIFSMNLLEELDLRLPKNCHDLSVLNDIQRFPRLERFFLYIPDWGYERENDIKWVVEMLGKCHQLRELELFLMGYVPDYSEMTMKLCERLINLKKLQVLKLFVQPFYGKDINIVCNENLARTFDRMICLQDLTFVRYIRSALRREIAKNKKYRFLELCQ